MGHFLHELIDLGFSQIYELEYTFTESEAGYGSHHAWGTYLAKKGVQFERVTIHERARYGFGARRNVDVSDEHVISEQEFIEATKDKEQIDTPERVKEIHEFNEKRKHRLDAEFQLNEIEHKCPACGENMTLRSGKYGGFWGCSHYPNCRGTLKMSAKEKKLYQQYAGE